MKYQIEAARLGGVSGTIIVTLAAYRDHVAGIVGRCDIAIPASVAENFSIGEWITLDLAAAE